MPGAVQQCCASCYLSLRYGLITIDVGVLYLCLCNVLFCHPMDSHVSREVPHGLAVYTIWARVPLLLSDLFSQT